MIVANSNPAGNPKSSNSTAGQEELQRAVQELQTLVSRIVSSVWEAVAGRANFDQFERTTRDLLRETGERMVTMFVAALGNGDLGEAVATDAGETLHRSATPTRTQFRSTFGVHFFRQFTYATGKNKAIALRPVSARLELPARQWSYLLQEFAQMFCIDQAYEQALRNLGAILGGEFSVATAEQLNGDLGADAGEFLADLPTPAPASEATLLVASADCKGVPLVKEDAAKVAAFETAKKNPGNRRMATVASVYSVEPHVRLAEEIVAALFRDDRDPEAPRVKRPKPKNKHTTAHLPCVEADGQGDSLPISGIHVAQAWIADQVSMRRQADQVLIAVMDGQEALWETLQLHLEFNARTIPVLDIIHVLGYVWEAAGLFERTDGARRDFTRRRLLRILQGEVGSVIRGLRRLGSTRRLVGVAKKALVRICGYLEKNAEKMRYDEYLLRGYPIASGVIEGACRHLVKDRMERSGMRWTLEGARNMLHLRAAFQSDHWRTFLDRRIAKEAERVHPHRRLLGDYQPITIAC